MDTPSRFRRQVAVWFSLQRMAVASCVVAVRHPQKPAHQQFNHSLFVFTHAKWTQQRLE
jgi:hypothetical protein